MLLFCCGWENFGQSFVFLRYWRSVFNFPECVSLAHPDLSCLRPLPLSTCYAGYQGFSLGKGFFVKYPLDRVASSSALLTSLYHRGCREGKGKSDAREGERRGTWHARERACQFVPLLQPRRLSWYLVYVYLLYLSKVSIILPVFLLVCPFFGNGVIFFISHFHFAQKTLSRKSLGTHSSLEESFTGLID